ncbi:WhiB family transcriptional regulator [Streptomyces sp. NPDC057250]|uniref:WhiB family transcriptional regulator n=1 Tax=Streptomyces sp. NPDC057250 TaxID=3346068 RepID=UPI0036429D37
MPRPGRYWPDTRHADLPRPAHWGDAAACWDADADLFYPEGSPAEVRAATAAAKEICRTCPVKHPCLIDSVQRGERWGVWGGMDENDRARLLQQMRPDRGGADARPSSATAAA